MDRIEALKNEQARPVGFAGLETIGMRSEQVRSYEAPRRESEVVSKGFKEAIAHEQKAIRKSDTLVKPAELARAVGTGTMSREQGLNYMLGGGQNGSIKYDSAPAAHDVVKSLESL